MKKLILPISALLLLFTSCDVKKSKEYQALKSQQDSLMLVNETNQAELYEMMSLIDEIESDFNQVRETEKILSMESQGDGSFTKEKRDKILNDMTMVRDIIDKNKKELASLNEKLKNSSGQVAGLKKTVERLNNELKERSETIVQLQAALEKRDTKISELETRLQTMKGSMDEFAEERQKQEQVLKDQEQKINTVYYMFGTSKELKESKVISGGFLRSTKILGENIESSSFIAIDKRITSEIPVFSKKAKILSEHPEGSYVFKKNDKDEIIISILDENKFWSLTRFLIVEVK